MALAGIPVGSAPPLSPTARELCRAGDPDGSRATRVSRGVPTATQQDRVCPGGAGQEGVLPATRRVRCLLRARASWGRRRGRSSPQKWGPQARKSWRRTPGPPGLLALVPRSEQRVYEEAGLGGLPRKPSERAHRRPGYRHR